MRGKILPRLSARLRVIRAGAFASASDARNPGRPPPTAAENPRPSSNGPKRFLQNPASPEGWRPRPGCSPADLRSGPEAAAARSPLRLGSRRSIPPNPASRFRPVSALAAPSHPDLTPPSLDKFRPPRPGDGAAPVPVSPPPECRLGPNSRRPSPKRARPAPSRPAAAAALRRRPDRAQERRPPLILGEGRRPRRRPGKPHRRPRAIPWPRAEVAPGHRQQAASSPPRARPVRRRNPRTSSATPRLSSTPPFSAAGAGSTGPVLAR